jgi:hypothetical protein
METSTFWAQKYMQLQAVTGSLPINVIIGPANEHEARVRVDPGQSPLVEFSQNGSRTSLGKSSKPLP